MSFIDAAGLLHQLAAGLDPLDAGADQALDLAGGVGAALGQVAHLAGHDGETTALLAGARGFHRGVERQDVGLEGDAVDGADDLGDLAAGGRDVGHVADHLGHHLAAVLGGRGRRADQLIGGAGRIGRLVHRAGELLH
jgi:hypothetical protein